MIKESSIRWACGAVGSALPWHGRGREFESHQVHQNSSFSRNLARSTTISIAAETALAKTETVAKNQTANHGVIHILRQQLLTHFRPQLSSNAIISPR